MANSITYTGVAGHAYEPINQKQATAQANEIRAEGGGNWSGWGSYRNQVGFRGFSRQSPHDYGFWNTDRRGHSHNTTYHYSAPSGHYANYQPSFFHWNFKQYRSVNSYNWQHHHSWKQNDWGDY